MRFTTLSVREGVWTGELEAETLPGRLLLIHDRTPLAVAAASASGRGAWRVQVAIPATAIETGRQALVLVADDGAGLASPAADAAMLAALPVVIGDGRAGGGIEAELAQLRAELDLVKRALRRLAARG